MFCLKLQNAQQLHNFISWISSWEAQIIPKQQKQTPHSLYSMLNAPFYQQIQLSTQISKRSTLTDCIIQICI